MNLELALLADAVNATENGKLNILGEFTRISAPKVPTVHAGMTIVIRVAGGDGEAGDHVLALTQVSPSGERTELLTGNFSLEVPGQYPGAPSRAVHIINWAAALFREFGPHFIEVAVDGGALGRIPLLVSPRE